MTKTILNPRFIFPALLAIAFFSCGKKKAVEVKMHVQSEVTGNPIPNAAIELSYYKDKESKGELQRMQLGITDANGNIDVKNNIKGKSFSHTIRVFAAGYGKIIAENLAVKIPFEPGKPTDQTVKLNPLYHYLVTLNSVGSFSPLDTVWVTGPGGFSAVCTGCNLGEECLPMNIYYNGYPGFHFSNWYTIPEITLNMKVRRGTSVSTSTKEVTLIEGQITPVELNF